MPHTDPFEIDPKSPPFDGIRAIRPLATNRSGREAAAHTRHQLYAGREKATNAQVLIKVTTKPGRVYEHNLENEIASLETINRELPDSRHFPLVRDHGRLRDGRVYLITSLFDEFPLATTIDAERAASRLVGHLRTTLAICGVLSELHALPIYHVDLNPMNILYRTEHGDPVIRIVDFESSYDPKRHGGGLFYDPPTTPHFSAPEVSRQAPDARSDVFSLGAVLYTMLAGYDWTWTGEAGASVEADTQLDAELKTILGPAVHADPDSRYRSIEAFRTAVGSYLETIWPGRSW